MRTLLSILLLTVSFSASAEYTVDEYDFYWPLLTREGVPIKIHRTFESTTVVMGEGMERVVMSPAQAKVLAPVLRRANEVFKQQKSGSDDNDIVIAGEYTVVFATGKHGFHVSVDEKDPGAFGRALVMSRKDALAAAKALKDVESRVAWLDETMPF